MLIFCGNLFVAIHIRLCAGAAEAFRGARIPVNVNPDPGDVTDDHVRLDPEVLLQCQVLGGNSIA